MGENKVLKLPYLHISNTYRTVCQFNPTLPLQQQLTPHITSTSSAARSSPDVRTAESGEYPYKTVHISHPGGGLPSSIARQARGSQYRTIDLRKALGEIFPRPIFWNRHYPTAEISAEGRMIYIVVYGIHLVSELTGCTKRAQNDSSRAAARY